MLASPDPVAHVLEEDALPVPWAASWMPQELYQAHVAQGKRYRSDFRLPVPFKERMPEKFPISIQILCEHAAGCVDSHLAPIALGFGGDLRTESFASTVYRATRVVKWRGQSSLPCFTWRRVQNVEHLTMKSEPHSA